MIVLYCSNRPRAFLVWQRGYKLLNPDVEVHMVQHPNSAKGYNKDIAYYVKGHGWAGLPIPTRTHVEKTYKELQN